MGLAIGVVLTSTAMVSAADKVRIGMVVPSLSNAIIADMNNGALERAGELGTVTILTTGSDAGEDQASAVENYVGQHVDAVVYDSIDAAAVGPAIAKANAAGIPVIAIFSSASGGKTATLLTPEFIETGRIIGRWMVGKVGKDGKVAIVEGNPADDSGAALVNGFKEGIASGGIARPVASAPTDWDRQRALSVATDMLTAHPDLQGIFAANDDTALGAMQAVKAAGRKGTVLVAGQNGTCEALAAVLRGDLDFDVMNFAKQLGRMSVDVALKLKAGEQVPTMVRAPTFGMDTATAHAIADGNMANVPEQLASEIKTRVLAAKTGCK
jgi:ABC-type sugar transport system substrate-binding protein